MSLTDTCSNSELILLSLFKDKVYQIYNKHKKNSTILNESRRRLTSRDYVDETNEEITAADLINGVIASVTEYTKWLTRYARELPGLDSINLDDFTKMVSFGTLLTMGNQLNEFFCNEKLYYVTLNGLQMTRKRLDKVFGPICATLSLLAHSKFTKLNFSDNEKSLEYPFIMCNCNSNPIQDKEKFFELKSFYTKMFIYELKLNGRGKQFIQDFKEVNLFQHFFE